MTEENLGYVHSIETFGTVDGPGVRYVVFMQGCRLRCAFCHNPDTWDMGGGTPYTAKEIVDQAEDYKAYWGDSGGITLSGGEPLLQLDFVLEVCKLAKERGIHTAIDTCGAPFTKEEPFYGRYDELMQYTDLILMDIKHINNEFHIGYTMSENTNILAMARDLAEREIPMWIRHVLVPEHSDFDEDLQALSNFIQSLGSAVKNVEVLPYHELGVYKYEELGIPYPLEGIDTPTEDRVENANRILKTDNYTDKS